MLNIIVKKYLATLQFSTRKYPGVAKLRCHTDARHKDDPQTVSTVADSRKIRMRVLYVSLPEILNLSRSYI